MLEWVRDHPGWGAIIAVVMLVMFGLASKGGDSSTTAPNAPSTQQVKAAVPHVLADFKGQGDQNSARFTVDGDWTIRYSFDCSNPYNVKGSFYVNVEGSDALSVDDVSRYGLKGNGELLVHDIGAFYLKVITGDGCTWHVIAKG